MNSYIYDSLVIFNQIIVYFDEPQCKISLYQLLELYIISNKTFNIFVKWIFNLKLIDFKFYVQFYNLHPTWNPTRTL
jgi:hypothetical protein